MSPRTKKLSAAFLFVSLLALMAAPTTDGRPCAEHSTHATAAATTWTTHVSPTHTRGYTHTHQHHHTTGNGQGATVTKTVTKTTTTTDTDVVTQTYSHHASPTGTWTSQPWTTSPAFSVAGAAPSSSPTTASGSSSGSGNGQCNTGPVQCCNSVQRASSLDSQSSSLLHSLDVILDDVDTLIGLTCSPLSGLGLGLGGSCAGTTVCCDNNSYNGLVNVGCVPIVLQL